MHAFAKFSATELIPLPWGPPIIQVKLFVTVKFPHYYVIVYYRKFFALERVRISFIKSRKSPNVWKTSAIYVERSENLFSP